MAALAPPPPAVIGFQWPLLVALALIRERRARQDEFIWAANNQHAAIWVVIATQIG